LPGARRGGRKGIWEVQMVRKFTVFLLFYGLAGGAPAGAALAAAQHDVVPASTAQLPALGADRRGGSREFAEFDISFNDTGINRSFSKIGINKIGFSKVGINANFSKIGIKSSFDMIGFNKIGINRSFSRIGINRGFDLIGFNKIGINRSVSKIGINRSFDMIGFNKLGINESFSKIGINNPAYAIWQILPAGANRGSPGVTIIRAPAEGAAIESSTGPTIIHAPGAAQE
jgi:hypothetical protein